MLHVQHFKVMLTPLSGTGVICNFKIKYKMKVIEYIRIIPVSVLSSLVFDMRVHAVYVYN